MRRIDAAIRTTSTRIISVPRVCWRRTILPARWKHCFLIARTDRGFRHDIGRTSLLALFDLLGSAHPLTRQYRQALSESLH